MAEWTEDRIAELKRLWAEGKSGSVIAAALGFESRNPVMGKISRLGLFRTSPNCKPGAPLTRRARKAPTPAQRPVEDGGSRDIARDLSLWISSELASTSTVGTPETALASPDRATLVAASTPSFPEATDTATSPEAAAPVVGPTALKDAEAPLPTHHQTSAPPPSPRRKPTPAKSDNRPRPIAKTPTEVPATWENQRQTAPILALRQNSCRYPIGDPQRDGFRFCCAEAAPGTSYCPHHAAIAYMPAYRRGMSKVA